MNELTLYNPASLSEDTLIEGFIVRTELFKDIFEIISNTESTNNKSHILIQGQRGLGKTTLLLRLKYEIERDNKLRKSILPVYFSEESYDVNSLATLWEKLLKYLDEYYNTDGLYYNSTEDFVDNENYEELCFNYLINVIRSKNKKIVLFFDNFGELFLDILKQKDKERLYSILLNCPLIQVIGSSAVVLDNFKINGERFFDLFNIFFLKGLNANETLELIKKLQENCSADSKINLNKSKAKIETLSILTGGVIRTIMMLYQVLLDDPYGKALDDLEKILDKVTPLYKHRIEDLPIQQRKIVDVIARKWDATSAKEIANEIREDGKRISTKIVSAQLNQLEKNNVIEKKSTSNKNNLYQIKERFFNIWYLMRNGDRRDKKRVVWLTKFLEIWYDDEDSQEIFIKKHINAISSGNYIPSSALLVFEALANSEKFNPLKLDDILRHTTKLFNDNEVKHLSDLVNSRKITAAITRYQQNKFDEAINILNSIKENDTSKLLILSQIYIETGKDNLAIELLNHIIYITDIDLIFFEKICFYFDKFDLFFEVLNRSKDSLIKSNVEYVIGEAYYDQQIYNNAYNHFEIAYKLGNVDAYGKMISSLFNLRDFKKMEGLLLTGFNMSIVDISELLNFYAFYAKDSDKLKEYLILSPKNGEYYLYLYLLDIGITDDDNNTNHGEDNSQDVSKLEQSIDLFLKENKGKKIQSKNFMLCASLLLSHYVDLLGDYSKGLNLIQRIEGKSDQNFYPFLVMKAIVLLVNNILDKELIMDVLTLWRIDDDDIENINTLMINLLAKSEYEFLYEIFNQNSAILKERFKPIYYALMKLLNNTYPDEIIKMGDELRIPVEEIIEDVTNLKEVYNMNK
ncbi:transcriptional repressor [Sphingobacterium lactis]|uniref:Ferric uptake regulator family protein n=1 Tax=Sphingobacterium lactis TaxID=797291 RepID=A0A1H5VII0_9SPHI|nr:transcriptional repressor [Sphingobacterium lactis]SEF87023.1 Ferric uptake regulator family protein [Sphingobacterium lactis]